MELTEIEAYTKRQEKKLSELLEEIRLAERQLDLSQQELTSDQKLKLIARLENEIKQLVERKHLETKDENLTDIEKIKKYKERVKQEYREMLSHREGIVLQTEEEQEELRQTTEKRLVILKDLWSKHADLERELDQVKQEKSRFVKSLEARETSIREREQAIKNKETEIVERVDDTQEVKEEYHLLIATASKEKEELEQKNRLTEGKEAELNGKIITYENKIQQLNDRDIKLEESRLELLKEKEAILKEKQRLKLDKEAVDKTMAEYSNRESAIQKDRAKLESQQESLRLAFLEAKERGII